MGYELLVDAAGDTHEGFEPGGLGPLQPGLEKVYGLLVLSACHDRRRRRAAAGHEAFAVVAAAPRLVVEPTSHLFGRGCHSDMRHGRLIQWVGRRMRP